MIRSTRTATSIPISVGWATSRWSSPTSRRTCPGRRFRDSSSSTTGDRGPAAGSNGYASWLDTEITEDWITKWDYDPVSYFGHQTSPIQWMRSERTRLQVNLKGNELAVSPPFKLHLTLDHAFLSPNRQLTIVPWVTAHWEDDSYLTIWNVDKHTDPDSWTVACDPRRGHQVHRRQA